MSTNPIAINASGSVWEKYLSSRMENPFQKIINPHTPTSVSITIFLWVSSYLSIFFSAVLRPLRFFFPANIIYIACENINMKILLGPAGAGGFAGSTIEGVRKLPGLGLQTMEVQFSHGIAMGNELAKKVGLENKKYNIKLSVHAPFFINLASKEKKKVEESKKRILDSCERAHFMGADPVVFHPAYFGGVEKEKVFQATKEAIIEMQGFIKRKGWEVRLAPETTGKHSALGSLDETIRLVKETGCFLCVDPAHLFARGYGKLDFGEMLDRLKFIKEPMHFHFSGIEYTSKGERNHIVLDHSPDFMEFAKELVKRKISCTIISESPITWQDSLKMKRVFEGMGYRFYKEI
jgi:deoxyribonuclease-4